MTSSSRVVAALLWIGVLAIAWLIYAPALSGVFLLDDVPNLSGLANVHDAASAVNFILSGSAGPLGRPLALATFVPQAADWNLSAEPFLAVNIAIHLANACLLWCVLYRLLESRCPATRERLFIAGAAATLWLVMPLLASSSLMIIQRMTTLSASFVLLGLLGYMVARSKVDEHPIRALLGMSAALVLGTLTAAFTKENGVLLPTFVLVLEATLLTRPRTLKPPHWRIWKSVFLAAPTVLILAYLCWRIPYSPQVIIYRDFTAWERLLTESRILWEYLFNAFIPRPGEFGPFHDGYPVARTLLDPATFLAFAGWVAVLLLALIWHRRYPLFAFAGLWYLGGHVIESTIVPLDLYYEHRNYLPIIGPLFALCALLTRVPSDRKRLSYVGAAVYALGSGLMLFNVTSLWGNPTVAFDYWQQRHPDSIYAATAEMAHVEVTQGPQATIRLINEFVESHPEQGYLELYELKLACMLDPDTNKASRIEGLTTSLARVDFSFTAVTMLSQLADLVHVSHCSGVDLQAVRTLARALHSNPRYRGSSRYNELHYQLVALTYVYEGDTVTSLEHLRTAMRYGRSSNLNQMMAFGLAATGDFEAAHEFIDGARSDAPRNPLKRYVWLSKLDQLDHSIKQWESRPTSEPSSGR